MQEKIDTLLDTALEKIRFFEYTKTYGLGMIHCLIEMYRIIKAMLYKKWDNKAILRGIDFV